MIRLTDAEAEAIRRLIESVDCSRSVDSALIASVYEKLTQGWITRLMQPRKRKAAR
jgi:hypothetical protein